MNVTDNIDIEVGHRHGIEQIEDDVGPPNNIEQIEDHVGPSTKTGLNVSGSLDSDLKRKIAAASSNRNRDRVSSRVSSVSERDTAVSETGTGTTGIGREDSKDITEVEESSSTAAVRSPTLHSTDDTTSAVQPSESVQFYPIEATVVNQSQTTTTVDDNNDEEQVYEAEFVPRWKKYVLSGTIVFFAILTVSIVGGVLAGSRSSSDTKETPPPEEERISSDFCPTMYSDFFRRQLTYHSKEVFSIANDGGYLG